jgi:hypothetical protein
MRAAKEGTRLPFGRGLIPGSFCASSLGLLVHTGLSWLEMGEYFVV